jgi:hypothetical protein
VEMLPICLASSARIPDEEDRGARDREGGGCGEETVEGGVLG